MQKHFIVLGDARRIEEVDAFLYSTAERTDYAFDGPRRSRVKALITVTAKDEQSLDYLTQYQRDRFASGLFGTVLVESLADAKREIAAHLVRS